MKNTLLSEKETAEMHEKPKAIVHKSLQEILTRGFIWSLIINSEFFTVLFFFLLLNGTFHGYIMKPLDTGFSL